MKTGRSIQTIDNTQKTAWNQQASHPLQSWDWGEFRKSTGLDVLRLGKYNKDVLEAGWQMTIHAIPHTNWKVGYIPKCPVPDTDVLDALRRIGREKNIVYIQIEPDTINDGSVRIPLPNAHHPLFARWSFLLDLTKPESELLSAMHPKTRYNIKLAQKHQVTVSVDNSEDAFSHYIRLTEETTNRQAFYAHTRSYHTKMWNIMRKAGIATLFTAAYQGEILTAWILFTWKNTLYYPYGASSRNHREVMAPTLMLWETALWGKKQGLSLYDLWGAMGPDPDTRDPWYGFHRFKEGFHPKHVEYLGSYDLVINPFLYQIYKIADTIRWKYLRFKKLL